MRRFWLIVLLLALLPLRGWTAAGMAVSATLSGPHANAYAQADAVAMPCHADRSADEPTAGPDAQAHGAAQASHLCFSCDLCHAALAPVAAGSATPEEVPGEGPLAGPSRDTGRLLAGCLERPPRA